MQVLYNIFNVIPDTGATVMLPIIITVVGLISGVKLGKVLHSGLILGIGFAGINLVINIMKSSTGPAVQAMVENPGIHLDILDMGWGSIAAVTWASPTIALLISAILVTNIIMLVLKATGTLGVDIRNYHHMVIVGTLVYYVTKNVFLDVSASVVTAVISFKLSSWTAPLVEDFFGIPDVSSPTMSAPSSMVIAAPLNWLPDRIPGVNKLGSSVKNAKKYLGIFGEPMMLGLIFGYVIGALARYSVVDILTLGVNMAAVMVLIPKMTSLLMEGLTPISEAAKKFCQEKFKGRELLIGLDTAIVVGNPDAITTSLTVIPLTILTAALLPGSRVFPFADLAVVTFRVVLPVATTKGNLFKNIIIGLLYTGATLLAGMATPPILTALASEVGLDLGSNMITSFAGPSLTVSYLIYTAPTKNLLITVPVMVAVIATVRVFMSHKIKKQAAEV